jgi:hypothetical protein
MTLKHTTGQICGRDYDVALPCIIHLKDKKRAQSRIHVDGLVKADGTHIRFKSRVKAERYIRNMRLAKD